MRRTIIDPDLTIDDVMRRWPATIRPFLQRGMLCIGCPIGAFHTVTDACDAHGVDPDAFAADLHAAAVGQPLAEAGLPDRVPMAGGGPARGGRCGG